MFGHTRALSSLYILSLSFSFASCQQSGDADPNAVVPFYVRNDEGGELVAVVVYGPNDYEQVAVYCRDSERDLITQGSGVMQCLKTSANEYDLILPFEFVRNASGVITGVSYENPDGIVVSFRTEMNSEGKVIAKTFDRAEDNSLTDTEYRIPYIIQRSEDGNHVAIVFIEDEQLTIPLRYITNSDSSRVIGVTFVPEKNERNVAPAVDAGIVAIVVFIGALACVGFFLRMRKRSALDHDDDVDDYSRDALKKHSETTADPDDGETVLCDQSLRR